MSRNIFLKYCDDDILHMYWCYLLLELFFLNSLLHIKKYIYAYYFV